MFVVIPKIYKKSKVTTFFLNFKIKRLLCKKRVIYVFFTDQRYNI